MEDVVYWEADEHHNCDGLVWAELLTIPVHEGDDAQDDHGHAENWDETCN